MHTAIWTTDLERSRAFYVSWFNGVSNEKYVNATKGFSSYFITFSGGFSLELMQRTDVVNIVPEPHIGLAHIAFTVGTEEQVDELIERFRSAGVTITGEPRHTGDGYYEGSILDPDGVLVEIVAS